MQRNRIAASLMTAVLLTGLLTTSAFAEEDQTEAVRYRVALTDYDSAALEKVFFAGEDVHWEQTNVVNSHIISEDAELWYYRDRFIYAKNGLSELYEMAVQLPGSYLSAQAAFLEARFPEMKIYNCEEEIEEMTESSEEPDEKDAADETEEEVVKICRKLADDVGFIYETQEIYYIPIEKIRYSSFGMEMDAPGMWLGKEDSEWNDDDDAWYCIFRPKNIDNKCFVSLQDENLLKIIYSEKYGLIYVKGGLQIGEILEEEAIPIEDQDVVRKNVNDLIMRYNIEGECIELTDNVTGIVMPLGTVVYPTDEESRYCAELLPCWIIRYKLTGTDIFPGLDYFEKVPENKGYMLLDAITGDVSVLTY